MLFLTFVFSPWDFYSITITITIIIIIIIIIIITKTIFMVLSSWQSHCES